MKHTLLSAGSVLLAFILAFSVLPGLPLTALGDPDPMGSNLIEDASSTFTNVTAISQTRWTGSIGNPTVSLITDAETGTCLSFVPASAYSSPVLNLAYYLSGSNALSGRYYLSFQYKITYLSGATVPAHPLGATIRTNTQTSFSPLHPNNQYYADLPVAEGSQAGVWHTYTTYFDVSDADLAITNRTWNFCLHLIQIAAVASIAIDNVSLCYYDETVLAHGVTSAQTWTENEAVFVSDTYYSDPYQDVTLDLSLTNGTVTYVIPAFWDGGRVWRARFVCPSAGTWTYTTVCSVTTDTGLHGQTGTVTCTAYDGDLAVYQHGFVKTVPNTKYFVYDDGTPFFYLGDTHWSLGRETVAMVETIASARQAQGFTVFQSEPIGAGFDLRNGVQENDMEGLADYDEKFRIIAAHGLVHANAEFFFPTDMKTFIIQNGGWSETVIDEATHGNDTLTLYDLSDAAKAALDRLSRYWVARYGAFPVMWTLGQEVDNDFYWNRDECNGHPEWGTQNNPYLYVAERIAYYDAYHHPLSGHQEGVSNTVASTSAFRANSAHTWYAAQWSQKYDTAINHTYPKDYWNNGQGKPVVDYEGKYCFLWTKNFGARVQGWMAYLSGMFGVAWGGQDTWSYLNTYGEDVASFDGVDVITPAEKQDAVWTDSLTYRSTYQLCYMRTFFENIVCDWHTLLPRFDNTTYFTPANSSVFYLCASNANHNKIVLYFYQFSDPSLAQIPNATPENAVKTGTLASLTPGANYRYIWFNPVTGQIDACGRFTASSSGTWNVGNKSTGDMVLYVIKSPATCTHTHTASFTQKEATCLEPGCAAHVFCTDCGQIIGGSLEKTPVLPHTPGADATCTTDQICLVCGTVVKRRFGHDLIETVTAPTCTQAGLTEAYCTRCAYTKTEAIPALGHTATDAAKMRMIGTRNYLITESDEYSPFREMSFDEGYQKDVSFYVFNDSDATLLYASVNYKWGYFALDDAASPSQTISGSLVHLNLAPHTGTTFTLTVPRYAYYSNAGGLLTDGVNDSLGQRVSYNRVGLRFMFPSNTVNATLYVACLSDPSVTRALATSSSMSNNDVFSRVTDASSLPADALSDMAAIGYTGDRILRSDCQHHDLRVSACTHCGAAIENAVLEELTSYGDHDFGGMTCCTQAQTCRLCQTTLPAVGHTYRRETVSPTCESAGYDRIICTTCGDITHNEVIPALGHQTADSAEITVGSSLHYLVTRTESGYTTPFRFMDFGDGDSKEVSFYVYNDTTQTLNGVYLSYRWGHYAYPDADHTSERLSGTWKNLALAPGSGRVFTLLLPRECYYSNLSGSLTDGQSDSLGVPIDYRDAGLRFMFGGSTTGSLYLTCLSDPAVTAALSQATSYNSADTIDRVITESGLPDAMALALKNQGVMGEKTYVGDCQTESYTAQKCVHCGQAASAHILTGTYGAHTFRAQNCTEDQFCLTCHQWVTASGHTYTTVETAPTCSHGGSLASVCSECGKTASTWSFHALAHAGTESAAMTIGGSRNYWVTRAGDNVVTPFKFLKFEDGDECEVTFYVYNGTDKTLSTVYLGYRWGYFAYPSATDLTRLPGSYVDVNLAPGTGGLVTLRVPRQAVYSNRSNAATDGANDSLGELVNYRHIGLRFSFSGSASGSFYVTCLSDPTVTQLLAETPSMSAADSIALITQLSLLPSAARSAMTNYGMGLSSCLHCHTALE